MTPAEVIAMRDELGGWLEGQFGWADSVHKEVADRLIRDGWVVAPSKSQKPTEIDNSTDQMSKE